MKQTKGADTMILLELFLVFARIGLFTFGGGYAMIALIENICVEKKHWITHDQMMDITVIAESTPGPIAINCATYIGYTQGDLAGAVLATLGIVSPAFLVIYPISLYLDNFMEIALIANAFRGIKIAVSLIILEAALNMRKKMQKKPLPRNIYLCAFGAMLVINLLSLKISSIALMLLAGIVSLSLTFMKGGAKK